MYISHDGRTLVDKLVVLTVDTRLFRVVYGCANWIPTTMGWYIGPSREATTALKPLFGIAG